MASILPLHYETVPFFFTLFITEMAEPTKRYYNLARKVILLLRSQEVKRFKALRSFQNRNTCLPWILNILMEKC